MMEAATAAVSLGDTRVAFYEKKGERERVVPVALLVKARQGNV